jgi:hypothetical protein
LLKILAQVTFHNAVIVLNYGSCLARSGAAEHKNNRRSYESANTTRMV